MTTVGTMVGTKVAQSAELLTEENALMALLRKCEDAGLLKDRD